MVPVYRLQLAPVTVVMPVHILAPFAILLYAHSNVAMATAQRQMCALVTLATLQQNLEVRALRVMCLYVKEVA